jgi:arabinose-5-phosphate isomerase
MNDDFSLEENVLKYATLNPKTIEDENILASEALVMIEEMKIQLLVVTDKQKRVHGMLHIHTLIEKGIS